MTSPLSIPLNKTQYIYPPEEITFEMEALLQIVGGEKTFHQPKEFKNKPIVRKRSGNPNVGKIANQFFCKCCCAEGNRFVSAYASSVTRHIKREHA